MQEKVKDALGGEFNWVGTRPVRPDGVDKVTGRAKFGADLHVANMLVGKVLRSPHAHARIKSIDTSAALALPGVKAVVTRDDFAELQRCAAGRIFFEAMMPFENFDIDARGVPLERAGRVGDELHRHVDRHAHARRPNERDLFRGGAQAFL